MTPVSADDVTADDPDLDDQHRHRDLTIWLLLEDHLHFAIRNVLYHDSGQVIGIETTAIPGMTPSSLKLDGSSSFGKLWASCDDLSGDDFEKEVLNTSTKEDFISEAARSGFHIEDMIQAERNCSSRGNLPLFAIQRCFQMPPWQEKMSMQLQEIDHLSIMEDLGKVHCLNQGSLRRKL
jgi:hypothetical protein